MRGRAVNATNYTEEEDRIITADFPLYGAHTVARKLGRPVEGVRARARRLGVRFGDLPGWTRIGTLAAATNHPTAAVYHRAKTEGVLRVLRPHASHHRGRAALVPNKWADKLMTELEDLREARELLDNTGWLTTEACARLWRVHKSTVAKALTGKGTLARHLQSVRKRRAIATGTGGWGAWAIHPWDAEDVRRALDAERARAKTMVSAKALALELGIRDTAMPAIAARYGGEKLLAYGGSRWFVTHEAAAVIRARYGRELAEAA